MVLNRRIPTLLTRHPSVLDVCLVGSRAEGRANERSDWDFLIKTSDFGAVAKALPELLAPLECLAQQWDPLSPHWVWMLMLRGPVKVDLVLAGRSHPPQLPWVPSATSLEAIEMHFWGWILWIDSKARADSALHKTELVKLFEHILAPLGVEAIPRTGTDAVALYLTARAEAEARFGLEVPRRLQAEVAPVLGQA